mgnify:CR=1 FL=1
MHDARDYGQAARVRFRESDAETVADVLQMLAAERERLTLKADEVARGAEKSVEPWLLCTCVMLTTTLQAAAAKLDLEQKSTFTSIVMTWLVAVESGATNW